MDKGTASLLGCTVVITAAIIGGVYLLDRANQSGQPIPAEQATWSELSPSSQLSYSSAPSSQPSQSEGVGSTINVTAVPAGTASPPGILVCEHHELGTFYTNAPSCNEADLDNRISHAESFTPVPARDRYSGSDYQTPQNEAGNSRSNRQQVNQKPDLRLHGKSPPNGLNVSCKFSVGKALEIERALAAAADPRESTWRESYCKQRCEAIKESCPVADGYFYYRFRFVCLNSDYYPCYVENS